MNYRTYLLASASVAVLADRIAADGLFEGSPQSFRDPERTPDENGVIIEAKTAR